MSVIRAGAPPRFASSASPAAPKQNGGAASCEAAPPSRRSE
ncbi:hypothetical protein BURPS668_3868 [Burkholderia pseudomallei 668]|nr:hypothetical protein BURPS668_3868 [Burkholderia pseudomallei 668]EEC33130.1 conserved hypothetical protein [Burkholderia pseudomallei 576]EET09467.1 hypothetical protein BURPS1710A_0126 [Burkholderia pseudomallei 1710a]